jgi:hypothetical protein
VVGGLAACGGDGGGSEHPKEKVVRGATFAFQTPYDWTVQRRGTTVTSMGEPGAEELVSVSVFRTTKPYRPELFEKAIPELDAAARQLAKQQGGEVKSAETVSLADGKVRQYEVEYEHGGEKLLERILFVFRGRTEYQLLCQWKASDDEPDACKQLIESFTPS